MARLANTFTQSGSTGALRGAEPKAAQPPRSRDFASVDPLGLAHLRAPTRPNREAALTSLLAWFLRMAEVRLHPSGTKAIHATLTSLLRPQDHVIVDGGADRAVFETVLNTGATLHRTPPGSVEAVERRLRRLSAGPRRGRIYIALSAVSAHGSTVADLPSLLDLARNHDARMVLDVTRDLGCMGPSGGGLMDLQGCLGRVDVVTGSFGFGFGARGGFSACRSASRSPQAAHFPDAARALAALNVIISDKGGVLRQRLQGNVLRLRNHLMADGLPVMGQPSPLVPVRLPILTATARTTLLHSAGVRVEHLHAPRVGAHSPRWRLHLSALHTAADIDDLADLIHDVTRVFGNRSRSLSTTYA